MDDDQSKKPRIPPLPAQTRILLDDDSLPPGKRRTIDEPRTFRQIMEKDVGIRFDLRKTTTRIQSGTPITHTRNGMALSHVQAKIFDVLRRQYTTDPTCWMTASQIRKSLTESEEKSVRRVLDFLTFNKFAIWNQLGNGIVGYRYVPAPGEANVRIASKLNLLLSKPKLEIEVEQPKNEVERNPSMGTALQTEASEGPSSEEIQIPHTPPTLTAGKRILFIADRANPENQTRIEAALGAKFVEWFIFNDRSPRQMDSKRESIARGSYDVVFVANSFMSHATGDGAKTSCERAGIPCVWVQKGRLNAVMRAIEAYASTPPVPVVQTSAQPVVERVFRPADTLMPTLKTLMKISPDAPIHFKEVVEAALKEMGLTLECMGKKDGRPNVYTPFLNGGEILAQSHKFISIDGRDWSLTDTGRMTAESGQFLAKVIQLPLAAPSEPPPPPPAVEEPVEPVEPPAAPDSALVSEATVKRRGGGLPDGHPLRWSGVELFRLEQLRGEGKTYPEIQPILLAEFGKERTLKTIAEQWGVYFTRKIKTPPESYYAARAAAKAAGWKPVEKIEPVVEAPEPESEIQIPVATPRPVAQPSLRVSAPPSVVPTRLRISTVSGEVEVEILDPAGSYLISTKHNLARIFGFLRSGSRSEVVHVEIVGVSGSSIMDTRRDIDEILMFLVG